MKRIIPIFILLFALNSMYAQNGEILYVNMDPYTVSAQTPWPGNHYIFDFDNNGTHDFFLSWGRFHPMGNAPILFGYTYDEWNWSEIENSIHIGDTISQIQSWGNAPLDPDNDPILSFDFGFSGDSIITCVRKPVDDGYCYGWFRYSVDSGPEVPSNPYYYPYAEFTIHDYAYCTIPNYPLRVGQTSFDWTGVAEIDEPSVAIHPNPTNGVVNISFSQDLECQSVEIYSLDGRIVGTFPETSLIKTSAEMPQQAILDISGLTSGVYILKVTMADGTVISNRIIKE